MKREKLIVAGCALIAIGLAVLAVQSVMQSPDYECLNNHVATRLQSFSKPQPHLHIESRTYDWGAVAEGEVIEHTFVVHNDGHGELVLQPLSQGSAGLRRQLEQVGLGRRIPPGGEATITISIRPRAWDRQLVQTFLTNDPNQKRLELHLEGDVTGRRRC